MEIVITFPMTKTESEKRRSRKGRTVEENRAGRLTHDDQWFRYWMRYCFQKLEVGGRKHVYLPLNRDYKPLGITSKELFDSYDDYLPQTVVFSADPHTFKGIWIKEEALYMYTDSPLSRVDYFARFERLLSRVVKLHAKIKQPH